MIITLTTDFGLADPFVGMMKGVMLGIAPNAQLVDLTHEIRSYDILEAAFIVESSYRYFPSGTVHVVVVDPGVGSERRADGGHRERAHFCSAGQRRVVADFAERCQSRLCPRLIESPIRVSSRVRSAALSMAATFLRRLRRIWRGERRSNRLVRASSIL